MIVSTDATKAFDKIQYSFMVKKKKKPLQTGNRKKHPQLDKDHLQKRAANIILNCEKPEDFW